MIQVRLRHEVATVVALVLAMLIVACTGNLRLTKADQLIFMYKTFNAQYEDYLAMAKKTDLTESQKDVLRKKKPILEELQKLIPLYDTALNTGHVSPGQEQQIFDLLNSLGGL